MPFAFCLVILLSQLLMVPKCMMASLWPAAIFSRSVFGVWWCSGTPNALRVLWHSMSHWLMAVLSVKVHRFFLWKWDFGMSSFPHSIMRFPFMPGRVGGCPQLVGVDALENYLEKHILQLLEDGNILRNVVIDLALIHWLLGAFKSCISNSFYLY